MKNKMNIFRFSEFMSIRKIDTIPMSEPIPALIALFCRYNVSSAHIKKFRKSSDRYVFENLCPQSHVFVSLLLLFTQVVFFYKLLLL